MNGRFQLMIMHALQWLSLGLGACLLSGCAHVPERPAGTPPGALDLFTLRAVPDHHYRLTLQLAGQEQRLNVHVHDGTARALRSTDPRLVGLEGRFELIGNGVFFIFLQNDAYRGSQFWLFRPDGSAVIKEVPDRGETQLALPVDDDSL